MYHGISAIGNMVVLNPCTRLLLLMAKNIVSRKPIPRNPQSSKPLPHNPQISIICWLSF